MQKNNLVKKMIIVAILIYLFGLIVLSALAWMNYYWLLGFLVGGAVALMSYFLGIFLMDNFWKITKTKTHGFWLGWARVLIQLAFHGVFLVMVIYINRKVNGFTIFNGQFSSLKSPINIIFYIVGIGLMAPSAFIAHLLSIFKKRRRYEGI